MRCPLRFGPNLHAGTGTVAKVYEAGSNQAGSDVSYTADTVFEIRLMPDGSVHYAAGRAVFFISSKKVVWPLHVGAVISSVQDVAFSHVQYLDQLPPAPPAVASPSPSPPIDIKPPPPLPPGDYVVFTDASADLVTSPGAVSRVLGPAGWNAAVWSDEDIWAASGPRKGISFRCPLSVGAKMIGFVRGAFKETSSYSDLEFSLYCAQYWPIHHAN